MPRYYDDEEKRFISQRERIINLLKEAGEEGVTNVELNKICFSYYTRLSELYKEGYIITAEHLENGLWKYVLKAVPGKVIIYPTATEHLIKTIDLNYGGVIASGDLKQLLDFLDFNVVRKPGYFRAKNLVQ